MQGHKVGYVDQNIRRQLDGIELDRFFVDKASGKNTARPKFQEMLSYSPCSSGCIDVSCAPVSVYSE